MNELRPAFVLDKPLPACDASPLMPGCPGPACPRVRCLWRTLTQTSVLQERMLRMSFPGWFWGFWNWFSNLLRFKDADDYVQS